MKEVYNCYLNGKFYGCGSLFYMKELFLDYVMKHKMYGKDEVEFKIVKRDKLIKQSFENATDVNFEALKKMDD